MMEIGRGTIRSIVCNADLIVDVVPVDHVVNTLICASWHNVMRRPKSLQIYNCTSGPFNPIRYCNPLESVKVQVPTGISIFK